MKINRRHVLIGGGIGVVAAAFSGVSVLTASLERGIVDSIRYSFPGLNMAEAELREFARQMAASWQMPGTNPLAAANVLDLAPVRFAANIFGKQRVRQAQGRIAGHFLRATNFLDPARGDGAVVLVARVNPYEAGCANMLNVFSDQSLAWPDEEADPDVSA